MNKHNPKKRKVTCWKGFDRTTWCGPFSVATVAGTEYEPAYQTLKRYEVSVIVKVSVIKTSHQLV